MKAHPDNVMANLIRKRFKQSGLSIKRLSELSGVPYAGCHATIGGTRDPALSTAARLCKVLGLELRVQKGK